MACHSERSAAESKNPYSIATHGGYATESAYVVAAHTGAPWNPPIAESNCVLINMNTGDECKNVPRFLKYMTTIIFVRHAATDLQNHDERLRELSPQGMEDRKRVTAYLSEKTIHAVLSSPYRRAVDTVSDFAQSCGIPIEVMDGFRERELPGWIEDFDVFVKRQWGDFNYKCPGCESLREAQLRCVAALESVLQKYAGKTVVIGCHGVALSTVINYYDGTFGYREFEQIRNIMPWIVEFDFKVDGTCTEIRQYDPIHRIRNTYKL